jgi:peptidoglycan/LPS O-acetylase OafA/YrhL
MGTLRFLLALSVVMDHAGPVLGVRLLPGRVAVEIFFAISGFYMAMILSGKYATAKSFYVSRFLRLYPVYVIVFAATWAWFFVCWGYLGRVPDNGWAAGWSSIAWWQKAFISAENLTMVGLDIPGVLCTNGAACANNMLTIPQAWSIGAEI